MFEFITKGLAKIFGDKSSRDIKNLLPIVDEVNKEFEGFNKRPNKRKNYRV